MKPPEKLVKALKKNKKVDNPWALANWLKNANTSAALSAILRGNKESKRFAESARMTEVIREASKSDEAKVVEGAIVKAILITEGLGNRHDMNYYSPEAIQSAPAIFEGKSCYIDHPSESESKDIPERRVKQKCGYFKNLTVQNVEGLAACIGELHFDLSESGKQAYLKACTALHYKQEFPGFNTEYVGLSIAADGDRERRTIQYQGETLDVNYVLRFTEAVSCDIVTSPARGGRFLALVESAAGAKKNRGSNPKEDKMKKGLEASLKAATTALEEAEKEQDPKAKLEKYAEGTKLHKAFIEEAMKCAGEEDGENGEEAGEENGDAAEDDGGEGGDSHTTITHKVVKKTGKAAVSAKGDGDDKDDDAVESKRIAIRSIAKEAGIDLPAEKLSSLMSLSLKEAKAEIISLQKMVSSMVARAMKEAAVPAANYAKLNETERKAAGASNNGLFADLHR